MRSFTIAILSFVVYTVSGAAIVSQDELTTESAIDNQESSVNNEAEELLKTIDDLLKEINDALANNRPRPPFNLPQPPFGLLHPPSFGPRPFPGFRHFDEDKFGGSRRFGENELFDGRFGNQRFGANRFRHNW
uniref:Uncharacterized protein n=1 Tax=Tetranychus urticae TaxID=32264 RepID=T1K4F5_TETUR